MASRREYSMLLRVAKATFGALILLSATQSLTGGRLFVESRELLDAKDLKGTPGIC